MTTSHTALAETALLLDLIAECPFFDFLDHAGRIEVARLLRRQSFTEGQVIFRDGHAGEEMYLICSGRVELFTADHTGDHVSLHVAGPGEIFGELSLFDGGPRTATAAALEDVDVCVLDREGLLAFVASQPEGALRLLAILGCRLRNTNDIVKGRLARNTNEEVERELGSLQKFAASLARAGGSLPFLCFNAGAVTCWVLANSDVIPGVKIFDPFPFYFLAIIVALESLFLSITVLFAQNLQSSRDKIRAQIQYEVNLRAEQEVQHLHRKMDQLRGEIIGLTAPAVVGRPLAVRPPPAPQKN